MCPGKSLVHGFTGDLPDTDTDTDVTILTSDGLRFPAHSYILAKGSTVMEKRLEVRQKTGEKLLIPVLGLPSHAVSIFLHFLYSSTTTTFTVEEEMDKYGIHLLALSHVFSVPTLKHKCSKGLATRLSVENVIDVLQLALLCDAPDLHLKGLKLVACKFKDVTKTEGWRFLQKHDPWLELHILQFINEHESRKKRRKRQKEEEWVYVELSEAMECVVHIFREGCTSVGPRDMDPTTQRKEACRRYSSTCQGLQMLIRHFATCEKRGNNGGCCRCKRMWQLLKLHASICDSHSQYHCRVPLCRQLKLRMQEERKQQGDKLTKWRVLVRKVLLAKTVSSIIMMSQSVPASSKLQ